jgi:D-3-phosphoglycerate dehydrogenase
VELDELLSHSDFVTIHAPRLESTSHMFNRKTFAKMKEGVRLINCARGGIVDEDALVEALQSGKIAGAALDVYEKEPLDTSSPLLNCDNIVLTPHLGASTTEAQVSVATLIAEQVDAGMKGESVSTAINIPSMSHEEAELLRPYARLAETLGGVTVQLIDGSLLEVEVRYTGELVGFDVSLLTRAVMKGILTPVVGSGVNYVNALVLAEQRKIKVDEVKVGDTGDYTNLVEVRVRTPDVERTVAGSVFDDNEPHILNIDGKRLDATPSGYMVVTRHKDRPGVIGAVGTAFGEADINIAGMIVGRDRVRGDAVMILTVDDQVSSEILELIKEKAGLYEARYVTL